MNTQRGTEWYGTPLQFKQTRIKPGLFSRGYLAVFFALCLTLTSIAFAQATPLPPQARTLLEQAQTTAQDARRQYANVTNHIDQPLWRHALRQGEEALELAPEHPDVLRFLAETYSYLRWNIRAWDFWQRYIDAGGVFDDDVLTQLSRAGNELGYTRYAAGDLQGALTYYQQVHDINPTNTEALTWLGRIRLEQGQPAQAQTYWQKLLTLDPEDEAAHYYLNRVEQQLAFGIEASDAFHAGLQTYSEGNHTEALAHFQDATRASPGFLEAHAWAGRIALELGQPDVARTHWLRVQEIDPEDTRAPYFLTVASDQSTFGFEAAQAYHAGLMLYQNQDLQGALEQFQAAVKANSTFVNALDWIARVFTELEQAPQAIAYWEALLAREPTHQRALQHLSLAQDQARYGAAAATAMSEGLRRYGLADYTGARDAFIEAAEHNPDYEDAWAWLGRIAFEQGEYLDAARYYDRALELAPENEDYLFFRDEAQYLSSPEPDAADPAADDAGTADDPEGTPAETGEPATEANDEPGQDGTP